MSAVLREIRMHCPNVTEIFLPRGVTAADVQDCSRAWSHLQEIGLSGSQADILLQVTSGFRHLTAVTANSYTYQARGGTKQVVSDFVGAITSSLQHLEFSAPFSNEALLKLSTGCPELVSLRGTFPDLTDEVVEDVARACPDLAMVDVSLSPFVTERGLAALARGGKLTSLSVCTAPGERALQLCPALQSLKLLCNVDPSQTMRLLGAHCPELTELTIFMHPARQVDDTAAVALAKGCPKLQRLRLNTHCSDGLLSALGEHCHGLCTLHLEFATNSGSVTDAGICALAQGCPMLHRLGGTLVSPITMEGIKCLATHCPRLREVDVSADVAGTSVNTQLAVHRLCVSVCYVIT
jgi:hypothetical protein